MYLCKLIKTSSKINMLKWLEKLAEGNKRGDILLFVSRDYEMVEAAVALRMSNRCKVIFSTKNHPIAITLEQCCIHVFSLYV